MRKGSVSTRKQNQSNWVALLSMISISVVVLFSIAILFRLARSSHQARPLNMPFFPPTITPFDVSNMALDRLPISSASMGSSPKVQQGSIRQDDPDRARTEASETAGPLAPDFTLRTLGGEEITLSDLRGKPVLINFWASWCEPCRLEMPELVNAYETYKDEGLVILAVDLTYQDALEDVRTFVEEFGLPFPVLLDETGEVTDELYNVMGIPMSFFVNREGVIVRRQIGAMTGEQIEEFVREMI